MPLTEEEEKEMYKKTLATDVNVGWIRERLVAGDKMLKDHGDRLIELEKEHSLLKGRLGAFILGLTFMISLLVNGVLWAYSHFGGKTEL